MRYSKALLLASSGFFAVQAAPSTRAAGIASQCTDLTLTSTWLIGNCLTGVDSTTRIKSSVYLNTKVTNTEGVLNWAVNGNFGASCTDCSITADAGLKCYCRGTFSGTDKITTLKLDEHIAVYKGHLLSDLAGPPTVPASSSNVAVPADPLLGANLAGENQKQCPADSNWSLSNPFTCWSFVYFDPIPFGGARFSKNNGWEVVAYETANCSGAPLATFSPGDQSCKIFSKSALSFYLKPLWNAN